jgi:hypothetical protein
MDREKPSESKIMLAEAANTATIRSNVLDALHQASTATGSDFGYLLDTAMRESGLKPQAKSGASSASGLFQFVDQTWLGLVKAHGAEFGLGSYASAISQDADGHFRTDNKADRAAILALRNDPRVASLMEGEYAKESRATLQSSLGRGVCDGELYAAHFLGPSAACRLIRMNSSQPSANAAAAFPQAASANRNVFYHANGSPKSVGEVYGWALQQTGRTTAAAPAPGAVTAALRTEDGPDQSPDQTWQSYGLLASASNPSGLPSSLGALAQMPFAMSVDLIDLLGSGDGSAGMASRGDSR